MTIGLTHDLRTDSGTDSGVLGPFRSMLTAQVVGTAFGLLFWVGATRLLPAGGVGIAAAAICVQALVGLVSALGLGTMLVRELPGQSPAVRRRLVLRSLGLTALGAAVLGAILVAVVLPLDNPLRQAVGHPAGALVFVVGCAAAGCALVLDEALLGLRRSDVQVRRNLLASGLRFPLAAALLGLGVGDPLVLQAAWVLALSGSVLLAFAHVRLPRERAGQTPSLRHDLATHLGPALRHHAVNLSLAAGSQLVPVVAALTLTAVANAEFAVAWLLATFVFLPPYLMSVSLYSHAANLSDEEFATAMKKTLPAALAISAALCIGAWALGGLVLSAFGGDYAERSWPLLAALVPAGLWMVFKDHLVARWRAQRRFRRATLLTGGAVALEVACATAGALYAGALGLCVGWLVAMGLEIVLAGRLLVHDLQLLRVFGVSGGMRVRTQHGLVRPELILATGILIASVGVGLSVYFDQTLTEERARGAGRVTCVPSSDQPGPMLDLGVQPATGDPARPLRSTAEVNELVSLAEGAGADVVSMTVSWRDVRPDEAGDYKFAALDRLMAAARRVGLRVKIQLVGVPAWALDDPALSDEWRPPLSPEELSHWATFTRDVMRHVAGRVDYVEVWTEPNEAMYWSTGPDPEAYANLLRTTHAAIRDVDDKVKIVTGGLSGNDIGYLENLYASLRALGSASSPFDMVGVHPFSGAEAPDKWDLDRRYQRQPFGTYDANFLGFRGLHEVMELNGDVDMPIYVSEFGYSTEPYADSEAVPDPVRAEYVDEALAATTCSSFVAAFSWYYLHPTPWNDGNWTLLDEANQPNETYGALSRWYRQREAAVGRGVG